MVLVELPQGAVGFLATPAVSAQLKDSHGKATSEITVGQSAIDTSFLTGAAPNAGGNVTYTPFVGGDCTGLRYVTPSFANGLIVNLASGTVPASQPVTFNSAGLYSWNAFYSGDRVNQGSTSPCEELKVDKTVPSLSLSLSSGSISVRASAAAKASLVNSTQNAGGTVRYQYFPGNACAGVNTTVPVGTSNVASVANAVIDKSSYRQFSRAGNYSWNAVYSGDSNNQGANSQCLTLAILPEGVTMKTILVAVGGATFPIGVGGSVYASVRLGGETPNAGGIVTYEYYRAASCQGIPTQVGLPIIVTNGNVPPSAHVKFNSTGPYSWNAFYSGDNNNTAASQCESSTVKLATPSLTLSLSSTAFAVGGSVTVTATLAGGFHPGGAVTYSYFFGTTCPFGSPNSLGSPPVGNNGVSSTVWSPDSAGYYTLNAIYGGDKNNTKATSLCLPLTVNTPGVQITTQLQYPSLAIGAPETDSVTLSGATANAGGTVTYQFFSGSYCSGTVLGSSSVTVTNVAVPNSPAQSFATTGLYSWNAVYSGDPHNNGATSPCEPLKVGHLAITSLSITCNRDSLVVGTVSSCTARLTNGLASLPTGKVQWSSNSSGTFSRTTCILSRGACSVNFQPTSAASSITLAATYGGDNNNFPSPTGTHRLTATQKKSTITISCSPTSISVASSKTIKCRDSVRGYGDLTGESVTWTQSGTGFVSFSSSTCELVKGSCSVTLSGVQGGSVTVIASYGGDSNNLSVNSKAVTLKITS